jgi:hypothetical protein
MAVIEWIPLVLHLPTQLDAVFTAHGIEDLGERDIYTGEDADGVDTPKLARFSGMTTLGGRVDEPVEGLMSPFQLDDASVEVTVGAELLVWLEPQPEERRLASLAALEPDGDAVFLGDCIPAWTPSFNRYVERRGRGLTGAELLTRILVDPNGPEAVAFRSSDETATPAGPIGTDKTNRASMNAGYPSLPRSASWRIVAPWTSRPRAFCASNSTRPTWRVPRTAKRGDGFVPGRHVLVR